MKINIKNFNHHISSAFIMLLILWLFMQFSFYIVLIPAALGFVVNFIYDCFLKEKDTL